MAQEYDFEPPERLYGNILARIEREKIRAARIRFVLLGTTALASVVALIPAYQYAASEFSQSGFSQYLSIVFSDSGIAVVYWKECASGIFISREYLNYEFQRFFRIKKNIVHDFRHPRAYRSTAYFPSGNVCRLP